MKPSSGGVVAPATARPSGPPARPRRASTDRHGSGSAALVPGAVPDPWKRPPTTARTSPIAGSSASSAPAATRASMDVSISSGESNSATLASLTHR